MSASSPFFFSLSPLPSLFSPVWFLGSWESKKSGFGVVPAKVGKSSGATFSKIQVDIASNCCQMAKNDRILADERPLQHFLAILAHFMQYIPGFLKTVPLGCGARAVCREHFFVVQKLSPK